MRQAKLRWFGHILQTDEGNKVKQTTKMEVRGAQAKGRMRWMDNTRNDMNKYGLEEGDGHDSRRWRRMVQIPDLAS